VPAGIVIPFTGYLSDRIGRKKIIVPALFTYALGGFIAGGAALIFKESAYGAILAGRIVQGIGAGGTYQLAMALTGDIFTSKERTKALGALEASNGLGKVISPVAGAAVALITWFTPFFVYAVAAVPAALAVWFVVREPSKKKAQQISAAKYFQGLGTVLKKKGWSLAACFLAGMLVLFLLFGVLSHFSDVFEERYNLKGVVKGLVIAIPVLALAITSYLSGTFLQKQLTKRLKTAVIVGLILTGISMTLVAFLMKPVPVIAVLALMGVGGGLVLPAVNTMVTSSTNHEKRGIVTAIYGTVRFFGVAIGPPAFAVGIKIGKLQTYLAAAAITAVILAFAIFAINQNKMLPKKLRQAEGAGAGKGGSGGGDEGDEGDEDEDEDEDETGDEAERGSATTRRRPALVKPMPGSPNARPARSGEVSPGGAAVLEDNDEDYDLSDFHFEDTW
ncbi:MAG: MFS transporter, partial [Bacillota bacterium]